MHSPSPITPLLLAGPTASGKSAVALRLAERLPGEIVSVDSMQVYRGLDIGTAKPSAEERARVPHHLLDLAGLEESFDAARFLHHARRAVADISARGLTPILCGGTGLYFQAFLGGLGDAPPSDPALRAELEQLPLAELLRELEQRDPACFAVVDRANPRRVVRAIEVIRLTGRPFSAQRADWTPSASAPPLFAQRRAPDDLRARIHARVDEMFARGLVEETRRLLAAGLAENPFAMQAIGYRQVAEHLRGDYPLAETIALVKTRTWQFARRQLTWLRQRLHPHWIETGVEDGAEKLAEEILRSRNRK